MLDFPDLASTTDADGVRHYDTPAGSLPSITTILGATKPQRDRDALYWWRRRIGDAAAERIRSDFARWGMAIHETLERALSGDPNPIDCLAEPEVSDTAAKIIYELGDRVGAVWGQEMAVWSEDLGVAGRLDFAGEIDGVPAVMDFKCVRSEKRRSQMTDYFLQGAFYAAACNEMAGTRIDRVVVVVARVDHGVQIVVEHAGPLLPALKARIGEYRNEEIPF